MLGEEDVRQGKYIILLSNERGQWREVNGCEVSHPQYHDISINCGIEPDAVCHDYPRGLLPGPVGPYDDCILQV
jgi:hypothetical protein